MPRATLSMPEVGHALVGPCGEGCRPSSGAGARREVEFEGQFDDGVQYKDQININIPSLIVAMIEEVVE